MRDFVIAVFAFGFALAPHATAQGQLFVWTDPPLVRSVAPAGDVDADGTDDFLLGAAGFDIQGLGVVSVRSGSTGGQILALTSATPGDGFGKSVVGLGDVDLDGHADFAVGASKLSLSTAPDYVSARSGANGSELWRFAPTDRSVGHAVAITSDIDLDGRADLIVGALATSAPTSAVFILSGATGAQILAIVAIPGATSSFGAAVARAGDFDGDGVEDLIVGDTASYQIPGRVTVHSGSTGAVLLTIPQPGAWGDFGRVIAALGDVTGDGVPDIAASSAQEPVIPGYTTGRVRLFSGADASMLVQIEGGGDLVYFGDSLARFPDLDGDGRDDLLLSAGSYRFGCCGYGAAEARIYSSGTHAILFMGAFQACGGTVVVPDVNGDGIGDYLIPTAEETSGFGGGQGAVLALTNVQPPVLDYWGCTPKQTSQGCRPQIIVQGAPSPTIGDDLMFTTWQVTPNSVGMYVWSRASAQIPFAGGMLCLARPLHRWPLVTSSGPQPYFQCGAVQTGVLRHTLSKSDLAATGIAPGNTFRVQAWFRDAGFAPPNDVGLSGAIDFVMWP